MEENEKRKMLLKLNELEEQVEGLKHATQKNKLNQEPQVTGSVSNCLPVASLLDFSMGHKALIHLL